MSRFRSLFLLLCVTAFACSSGCGEKPTEPAEEIAPAQTEAEAVAEKLAAGPA